MDAETKQRIEELEMALVGKHPDEEGYLNSLRIKYGTDEEKAAQAKLAEEHANRPAVMRLQDSSGMGLQDALRRIQELEERERTRNLAAEMGMQKKAPPIKPSATD